MVLAIEPTDATLGAIVTGVRLARLVPGEWDAIEVAFNQYAVLIFPGQHLSHDEQLEVSRLFGELELEVDVTNLDPEGEPRDRDDPGLIPYLGNEHWHTDSSFRPVSSKASMLTARVIPDVGGETEWADMRAAYDELSPEERQRLGTLSAFHSYDYSQRKVGDPRAVNDGYDASSGPAPLRPLVKYHPDTDRPSLFVGRHAHGVPGMSPEDSERLLDELMARACRAPRVIRHQWTPGDFVVWDNRCLLHRALPYDLSESRVLFHTRIAGDPVSEAALPAQ